MQTELNIEAVKLYIAEEGENCPFCGESSPEGSSFDIVDGAARQEMTCTACEVEWTDSYHLAAVIYDGEVFEPNEELDALKAENEKLKADMAKLKLSNHDTMQALFRRFKSSNFVEVADMMDEMSRHLAVNPMSDSLKADMNLFNQWSLIDLNSLWRRLRAEDPGTLEGVMAEIALFIGEKRGDLTSLCGCGGSLHHYDGMLGYEAMVCADCEQHFPVL